MRSLSERVKSRERPMAIKFTPARYGVLCFLTRRCFMCCATLLSSALHCRPSTSECCKDVLQLLVAEHRQRPKEKINKSPHGVTNLTFGVSFLCF